jgi:hypothetical protein
VTPLFAAVSCKGFEYRLLESNMLGIVYLFVITVLHAINNFTVRLLSTQDASCKKDGEMSILSFTSRRFQVPEKPRHAN